MRKRRRSRAGNPDHSGAKQCIFGCRRDLNCSEPLVTPSAPPNREARDALTRYSVLTQLLDQAFRVPFTTWRFGIDSLVGLVPGLGDVATGLLGAYGLLVALRLGAPASIQLRMLMNLGIDTVVGAVPLFGDAFDFVFKANVRNRTLLERWMATPHATHRSSRLLLLLLLATLLGLVAGAIWLALWLVRALFSLGHS
jgi:hypothetical protein